MTSASFSRRTVLRAGAAGAAALALDGVAGLSSARADVEPTAFDYDALSAAMRRRAAMAYQAPETELPSELTDLTYDQHRLIVFRPERALWRDDPVSFQLQAFHPGSIFRDTTRIFVGDGRRFELQKFETSDFDYLAPLDEAAFRAIELPGVAGFRLHFPLERPDFFDELVTFLGASYFRALGQGTRYGLSARGLAVNTATGEAEEFPSFTTFYLVRPKPIETSFQLYAELDSPSLTGAYSFGVTPGAPTLIDVTARLFFRNTVERLGVAPLTSMFLFGENDRADHDDFRPEVHDSDGLAIHRANGERLWRPLRNPAELAISYFADTSPKSFGLLQRDRRFTSYEDIEARYELRPSLLIEPLGDWGKGAVQLVEIPTNSEANDNIVAFWVPDEAPQPGVDYEYRYRMRWGLEAEDAPPMARVGSTLVGVGGNAAAVDPGPTRRFVVDFTGPEVERLPDAAGLQPLVWVSENCRLHHSGLLRLPQGGWRISIEAERIGSGPIEMQAKLSMLQRIISETWLYQWTEG